ncbi:family 43 glycosylhydrolase [Nakamurella aerolata]|uniref:Family 43 glycosylhydrolase n=1 Tax=Nakamurella aerolata TaxID=1656892 RepID=A0A849AC75_9ACTN|nr:family 43 glycosylhydrolase [Nakamurella aerolata]NNG36090.1 family 43 glycosylhydrolase [Nakamurella aerolata]
MALVIALTAGLVSGPAAGASGASEASDAGAAGRQLPPEYRNPLRLTLPDGLTAASCADPDVTRGEGGEWYLYCTSDRGTDEPGGFEPGLLPIYRSTDLVNWTYVRAAVENRPSYAVADAGLWAPDIVKVGREYRLYYAVSDTTLPGAGAAVGVAVGSSPAGPFTVSDRPVVEPQPNPDNPRFRRSTIDPEVIVSNGQAYMFYGGFGGGISARRLSADGLSTDAASERPIAIGDRYEGSYLVKRGGWWYLMMSSTNCCNGPLTGYTVFAARSKSLLGPYRDRTGASVLDSRVGGTPVVTQNGNSWVGVGHNSMVTDLAGQDWMVYHGIKEADPYYRGAVGYTKRPALIDPVDWVGGWPTVRRGAGSSDRAQPGPVTRPDQRQGYRPQPVRDPRLGRTIAADRFTDPHLDGWTWVRRPDSSTYRAGNGSLRWQTQAGDIQPPSASPLASILTRPAPAGDYAVTATVSVDVPADRSVHNFVQGGLVIYNDDTSYLKLVAVSIGVTRQTEFGKRVAPQPGYPAYGNAVVGVQGASQTHLRIVAKACGPVSCYTAYTSPDGHRWVRGATWRQAATDHTRIGLISMGGTGFTTTFSDVRVNALR